MRTQLTIGKKLGIGVMAFTACSAVLSVTSLSVIATLGGSLDAALNTTGRKLDLAGGVRDAFQELKATSEGVQLTYAIAALQRRSAANADLSCLACHAPAPTDTSLREIAAGGEAVKARSGELRRLISDDSERKAIDSLDAGAAHWVDYTKEYLSLANSNRFEDAHGVLLDKMLPSLEEAEKAGKLLAQRERTALGASDAEAKSTISTGRWAVWIVIGVNLGVAAAMFWVVFRITSTLRQVATEVGNGTEEVRAAAAQLSSSSQSLAAGCSEQAASLEETSASSEEINAMTLKNSENLSQAADLVTQSQEKFTQTEHALSEMVAAMSEINAQSGKISRIIGVIDEIAFQTNILALNAAVEAARAGGAGLGFAVVADEVRNLAQRSAVAAKDTAQLIEGSIAGSKDGNVKVDQVAVAVRAIAGSMAEMKTLVDEVNLGSQEQARGIAQIGKAILQIEQVTQKTAAVAEESAAAAQELNAQAETRKEIVERLTSMVGSS